MLEDRLFYSEVVKYALKFAIIYFKNSIPTLLCCLACRREREYVAWSAFHPTDMTVLVCGNVAT